jgi:hypothetical protein
MKKFVPISFVLNGSTHTIYFKGDLKDINTTATGGSNGNQSLAGPYGWDIPAYHLTIT